MKKKIRSEFICYSNSVLLIVFRVLTIHTDSNNECIKAF